MRLNEVFLNISDWIGGIVDIIEFIGILIAVATFVFAAFIPIARPLRTFLGKYKMRMGDAMWALWRCRSNPKLLVRCYIESAIFKTEGYPMDRDGWKELRGIFKDRLKVYNETGEFRITVDSVSVMISADVKEMIAEYFSFLAGERKCRRFWNKANVDKDSLRKDAFCSVVTVRSGYLAPLARIAGINDRYEENWNDIMANFADTCNASLVPQRYLSYTYTWLMWGPSIQTASLNTAGNDVLGIYGYSDEANSFFVAIPRESFEDLFNGGVICEPCSISGHIVNPLSYVSDNAPSFNTGSHPFLDRVRHQYRTDHDYILDADDIHTETDHDHYFTAYIWGIFLASKDTGAKPAFTFSNAIGFFEHTNLSDRDSSSLAPVFKVLSDKFRNCFSSPGGLTYHFVSAVNDDTAEALRDSLQDLPNVSFEHKYTFAEILEAIDSHFNSESWCVLPKESYGDLVDLCYSAFGGRSADELTRIFGLLGSSTAVVLGMKTRQGSLDAAGIAELKNGTYTIVKSLRRPTSVIRDSDILGFSDREIRDLIRG